MNHRETFLAWVKFLMEGKPTPGERENAYKVMSDIVEANRNDSTGDKSFTQEQWYAADDLIVALAIAPRALLVLRGGDPATQGVQDLTKVTWEWMRLRAEGFSPGYGFVEPTNPRGVPFVDDDIPF